MSVRRSTLLVPAVPTETSTLPSSPWLQPVAPKADGKVHIPGRAYHTAVVFGTQLWFFGGSTALGETSDLLVLDLHPNRPATWFEPSADVKDAAAEWPGARQGHVAVRVGQQLMLVTGGCFNGRECGDMWMLDISSGRWTEMLPCAGQQFPSRFGMTAAIVKHETDYYCVVQGGRNDTETFSDMNLMSLSSK